MKLAPSGEQFTITAGTQRATLVEVGGGIREYISNDRHLLDGYALEEMVSGARGTPLIPWPNRIADGAYTFQGANYQLALTEPARHNAIHGLLRWRNWAPRRQDTDRVVLGAVIHPEPGYPFTLDVAIEYTVRENPTESHRRGLTVTTTATNSGDTACPYATGHHPYLLAGPGKIDETSVRLDAASWLPTDERGLPTGQLPVAGTPLDFRTSRAIGATQIDHAFTDIARAEDGTAWVELTAPDGSRTRLWADQNYRFIQLYTGDTLPENRRRASLAVEPMTCPPNGFRTGVGLLVLQPGQTVVTEWGIQPD